MEAGTDHDYTDPREQPVHADARDRLAPAARLKVVCAWCSAVMVEGPAHPVSHGMCPGCLATWTAECDAQARRASEAAA